jgi:acetoin utilization deacetylase AcuC-like enzyme
MSVQSPQSRRVCTGERIALVVSDLHAIHHVRERGYLESPARMEAILRHVRRTGLFEEVQPRRFPEAHIKAVHDADFLKYFKRACASQPPGQYLYPYIFPLRNADRPPQDLELSAGYYCMDTFTPIHRDAYRAARRAAECTLTAADEILLGRPLAYALARPPGHHSERRAFGGFCYLNSTAIAAHYLSAHGKVAILDLDYHHGNGQQDIFYERADVLTLSIHCSPRFAYPYFSGFVDERGAGEGEGFNANYPLPEKVDGAAYREALRRALRRVARFRPRFLMVALGLDTALGDPTGSWSLLADDFEENGRMVGALGLPTVVVQEGGYDKRVLGTNARRFFQGIWRGAHGGCEG